MRLRKAGTKIPLRSFTHDTAWAARAISMTDRTKMRSHIGLQEGSVSGWQILRAS